VLHDASFRDDPTRLWRIARYAARLGFELEPHTAQLAAAAVAAGYAERVSGARIGNELRLALAEPDPVAALQAAVRLGLAPWLAPDPERTAAALGLLPAGEGRADLVVLAAAIAESGDDADQRLAGLDFKASERAILRAAARAPEIAASALAAQRPSELARALRGLPVEAVALAGAAGAVEPVRRWLSELRHVALEIDGDDLLAAGVARGPQIGRRLAATLDLRLDGELGDDRDAQLAAALAAS
jgi:tRNA nucleotidyltransferase (CCA-adding enzyme)